MIMATTNRSDELTTSRSESNRETDFRVLQKAAELLQDKLKYDEAYGDLYERIGCKRFADYSRLLNGNDYFVDPYRSQQWGPTMEHVKFAPMPSQIVEQSSKLECASFMGIIPEINRKRMVWITIDNKLYLWNYLKSDEMTIEDCETFTGMKEVIFSVSLATPKAEIFSDKVQYILVVASPVEIVLLAVLMPLSDESGQCNQIKLISTAVSLPSDNITMFKIVGAKSGRIFMAGNDGNLYELDYAHKEKSWASLLGIDSDDTSSLGERVKCQKVNHFKWNWQLVHLLPPVVRAVAGIQDEGVLVDILVDDVRQVLYTLTTTSCLSVLYLGLNGLQAVFVVKHFNILSEASQYLARNRVGVSSNSSRNAEAFISGVSEQSLGFKIVGIFIVPAIESAKIHLIAVLGNATRIYLSLVFSEGGLFGSSGTGSAAPESPVGIEIAFIRFAPSAEAISTALAIHKNSPNDSSSGLETDVNGGFQATCASSPNIVTVGNCFYCRGCVLLAVENYKGKQSLSALTTQSIGGEEEADQLLTIFEDSVIQRSNTMMLQDNSLSSQSYREGLASDILYPPSAFSGQRVTNSSHLMSGRIFDIKESISSFIFNSNKAQLNALYFISQTPTSNAMIRDTTHHVASAKSLNQRILSVPVTPSPALSKASTVVANASIVSGYDPANLRNVAFLSESCASQAPFGPANSSNISSSLQRHFVVLTNNGVHILRKKRLSDVIFKSLMQIDAIENIQALSAYFNDSLGKLNFCTICLGLAIGLPADAGGVGAVTPLPAIQMRAMSIIREFSEGPSFRVIGGGSALTDLNSSVSSDSRLILSGNSREFVPSTLHEAVFLLASRLLRPIWLRPVVGTGGKVAGLWTPELIAQLSEPISELMKLLQGYYPSAIHSSPGSADSAAVSAPLDSRLLTAQMLLASQANKRSSVHPDKQLQQQAKAQEEASIAGIFRLLSRSLQALTLMSLLISLQDRWKLSVSWALLGDLVSFRALVTSPKVHDQVRKLLSEFVAGASRGDGAGERPGLAGAVNGAIAVMIDKCYHFFSAGDWFSFTASRKIEALKNKLSGTGAGAGAGAGTVALISESSEGEIATLQKEVVQLLLLSAKHWNSVDFVVGAQSTLRSRCADLMSFQSQLGRVGTVELCLSAASGFSRLITGRSQAADSYKTDSAFKALNSADVEKWDIGLYHGGSAIGEADLKRAIDACYQCLADVILQLRSLRDSPGTHDNFETNAVDRMMSEMIELTVSKSSDPALHYILYSALLDGNEFELLLSVRNPLLEKFLHENNTVLLYSYFEHHGEFIKASNLMSILARSEEDTSLDVRTDYLNKAISSAQRAISSSPASASLVSSRVPLSSIQLVMENLNELQDLLDVIGYQQMAERVLASDYHDLCQHLQNSGTGDAGTDRRTKENLEIMESNVYRLKYKLLTISELYHDICVPYKLWDISLLLLHASKSGDLDLVAKLWRSLIYRYVPVRADQEENQQFLRSKRAKDRNLLEVYERYDNTAAAFEDATFWMPALLKAITSLGEPLLGSVTFPGIVILEELEDIIAALSSSQVPVQRGVLIDCFLDVGLSFGGLLELYIELLDSWSAKKTATRQLQVLSSATGILLQWVDITMQRSHLADSAAFSRELMLAIRSGRVRGWQEKLRRFISSLSSKFSNVEDVQSRKLLEETSHEFYRINSRITELTIV